MFQSKNPTFDNGVETTDFGIVSPEWRCLLQSDLPGLTGIVAYGIQERISMVLSSAGRILWCVVQSKNLDFCD